MWISSLRTACRELHRQDGRKRAREPRPYIILKCQDLKLRHNCAYTTGEHRIAMYKWPLSGLSK